MYSKSKAVRYPHDQTDAGYRNLPDYQNVIPNVYLKGPIHCKLNCEV